MTFFHSITIYLALYSKSRNYVHNTVSLITVTTPTFCMPIESCNCIQTRDSFLLLQWNLP